MTDKAAELKQRIDLAKAEVERLRAELRNPWAKPVTAKMSFSALSQQEEIDIARTDLRHAQNVLGELLLQQTKLLGLDLDASDETLLNAAQARADRREFWFRRFNTSLGVAHGAGLAAIVSKLFDKDVTAATVSGTWWAMSAFALGLVVAGLLPVALYLERPRWAWGLAGASAVVFVLALGVALGAAAVKAQHIWPFW